MQARTSQPAQFYSYGCLHVLSGHHNPIVLIAFIVRLVSSLCVVVLLVLIRYLSSAFKSRFIDLNPAELGYFC